MELNDINVHKVLDEIRPYIEADGGILEYVAIDYRKEGTIVSWYNNVLRPSSVYSEGYEKVHHYWDNDRITYHEVELEIPDKARIDWYLKGDGDVYYAPKLIVDNNDL